MIKIYDCSNSSERPQHRGGGGPFENDIMRYLKEYAHNYDCTFVKELEKCDVVITNDVFPGNVVNSRKRLVKRMCSPYWQTKYINRNGPLNFAAVQADKVIYISDYSARCYYEMCKGLAKSSDIIHHWVDPKIYNINKISLNKKFIFAAAATSWSREEKRLKDIIKFAEIGFNDFEITLIGNISCQITLPRNIIPVGYYENPVDMAIMLNKADGFLNLSYRDAATKTVPQAISCGLPVLYANSGGVGEMVGEYGQYGVGIKDDYDFIYEKNVPELSYEAMEKGYYEYMDDYQKIKNLLAKFDPNKKFNKMLDEYFWSIKSVL